MKSKSIALWVSLASSVTVAVACSSSDSSGPTLGTGTNDTDASTQDSGPAVTHDSGPAPEEDVYVPPSVATACDALASAICDKLQTCSAIELAAVYGDLDACKERNVKGCTASSGAAGAATTTTADKLTACTASVPDLACSKVVGVDFGPACAIAGTKQSGDPCGYNSECAASLFCAIDPTASCGTCAPLTANGDACVQGSCSPGLLCSGSDDDNKCYTTGNAQIGEDCSHQSDCLANGGACNPISNKCIALSIATNKCGLAGDGYATCSANAPCSNRAGNGTCGTSTNDGACSSTANCVAPARCIGGTCALPSISCQ